MMAACPLAVLPIQLIHRDYGEHLNLSSRLVLVVLYDALLNQRGV